MSLFIKNINIITETKIVTGNILIEKGIIKSISETTENSEKNITNIKTINGSGKFLFPGAIDPHTHLELDLGPNRISSDTFKSGTYAALKGGVTTMFTFAHQELQNETLLQAYNRRQAAAKDQIKNNCMFHSGIMHLSENTEEQIYEIARHNIKTFKIYLNSIETTGEFLYRTFCAIKEVDGIALIHSEEGSIIEYLKKKFNVLNRKETKWIPESRPDYLELSSLIRADVLSKNIGAKLYIVHISTAMAADYIKKSKLDGHWLEGETCNQYLLLDESEYNKPDGYLRTCTPPFRKKYDNNILWDRLKDGTIKIIATDHCPFLKKQKDRFKENFINYVYGLAGVEFSPLLFISEARKRNLDWTLISTLLSTNASKIFGLYPEKGVIKEGCIADLFIYNPEGNYILKADNLHMNTDVIPFENYSVNGKIETVIYNGVIVR